MSQWTSGYFCSVTRFLLLAFIIAPLFSLNAQAPPKYIWNLGLAMMCDVSPLKGGLPQDYTTLPAPYYINPKHYIKKIKEGDIIWLQSHQVDYFYRKILPEISNRFILLINDGDHSFPSSYRKSFDVDMLINDKRVIHIFAQNVDALRLKKVTGIPIGIDFHTAAHSQNCHTFEETRQSVQEQEASLDLILSRLLPTDKRIKMAFVDFHLADRGIFDGESRTSIFKKIYPTGLIDALSQHIPRHLLWQTKGQYAFSISPRGNGLDCHRTWEDLVLGCIVIVKTSPLDSIYKGLPVVIVKDWSEITPENFDKWLLQYSDAFTNPEYRKRLTSTYWMDIIRSKKPTKSKRKNH